MANRIGVLEYRSSRPTDSREAPRYGVKEAASYLGISLSTLKSWTKGRYYPAKHRERRFFKPLIKTQVGCLSFYNLVEAHILLATRKKHRLELHAIRSALDYVAREFPSPHPLLTEEFLTDGKDLFVKKLEQTINVSRRGQLGIGPILDLYLKRIERDRSGLPMKLFPLRVDWQGGPGKEPPKVVVLDPNISSGRPVVVGTGIMATVLAGRFKSGESIPELAHDYGLDTGQIEEVIRYAPAA